MATNNLSDVITQAAELDESIRKRVIRLAHKALDKTEFLLDHGDPRIQSQIIKQYLGTFNTYMETRNVDSEVEELRRMLENLQALVIGRKPGELTAGDGSIIDAELVEIDTPPK